MYRAPVLLRNGHLHTLYAALLGRRARVPFERERIETPDDDFLDLDWARRGSGRLLILSHGLEGSSGSRYIVNTAAVGLAAGWDILAWNMRGCSGEPNRRVYSYHSGKSEDLATVIEHARALSRYRRIGLIGFSVGGNITLRYLALAGESLPRELAGAATFSVPCDLAAAATHLSCPANYLYLRRFLTSLKRGIAAKARHHPGQLDLSGLQRISSFHDFDSRYTAPLNGFPSAEAYWWAASSAPLLARIRCPTLLVNAADDPLLPAACTPRPETLKGGAVALECPLTGGHAAFLGGTGFWPARRALDLLEGMLKRGP